MFWDTVLKSIFCLFLLTECSSQLPGLRLSGKLCEGAKDLRVASLWPISNADRNEKLHVLFNFFEGLINRCLNMSIWQKVPFTLSPEHVVVCCEVQTALCQGSTAGRRSAGLLKGSLLVRCDLLNSCSSVTSHLVHWLGKKESACSVYLCCEEMEITRCYCCPRYSTCALLGLDHGKAVVIFWEIFHLRVVWRWARWLL